MPLRRVAHNEGEQHSDDVYRRSWDKPAEHFCNRQIGIIYVGSTENSYVEIIPMGSDPAVQIQVIAGTFEDDHCHNLVANSTYALNKAAWAIDAKTNDCFIDPSFSGFDSVLIDEIQGESTLVEYHYMKESFQFKKGETPESLYDRALLGIAFSNSGTSVEEVSVFINTTGDRCYGEWSYGDVVDLGPSVITAANITSLEEGRCRNLECTSPPWYMIVLGVIIVIPLMIFVIPKVMKACVCFCLEAVGNDSDPEQQERKRQQEEDDKARKREYDRKIREIEDKVRRGELSPSHLL